jgi:hypothetical protein
MSPERVQEDFKSETVQNLHWRDLPAFSSCEINKETKANSTGKSIDNEEKREQIERIKQEYRYFSYRHKKFGNCYGTI